MGEKICFLILLWASSFRLLLCVCLVWICLLDLTGLEYREWNRMVGQAGPLVGWLVVGLLQVGWAGSTERAAKHWDPPNKRLELCVFVSVSMRLLSLFFLLCRSLRCSTCPPRPPTHSQRCFIRGIIRIQQKDLVWGCTGGGLLRRNHAATLGEIHQEPQHWGQQITIIITIIISGASQAPNSACDSQLGDVVLIYFLLGT